MGVQMPLCIHFAANINIMHMDASVTVHELDLRVGSACRHDVQLSAKVGLTV